MGFGPKCLKISVKAGKLSPQSVSRVHSWEVPKKLFGMRVPLAIFGSTEEVNWPQPWTGRLGAVVGTLRGLNCRRDLPGKPELLLLLLLLSLLPTTLMLPGAPIWSAACCEHWYLRRAHNMIASNPVPAMIASCGIELTAPGFVYRLRKYMLLEGYTLLDTSQTVLCPQR